jgi:phosphoribosylanthranilate isomerase
MRDHDTNAPSGTGTLSPAARAKICGLSTPETVQAALDGAAGFIGFMIFDRSPRNVGLDLAAHLARPVRGRAKIVAVTVDPDDELIDRIAAVLAPDLIQLHGAETPARARLVAERAGIGVIKALPVAEPDDLRGASQYDEIAEHLMFDARPPPATGRPGGGGVAFDWSILSGRRFARPWFLAGGLTPWNVAEALEVSGAPLADVSSGVERGAGLKDPTLIRAFLDAVGRA